MGSDTSYGACWVSHLPGAVAISLFPMPMYLFPNVGIEVPSEPNAEPFVLDPSSGLKIRAMQRQVCVSEGDKFLFKN